MPQKFIKSTEFVNLLTTYFNKNKKNNKLLIFILMHSQPLLCTNKKQHYHNYSTLTLKKKIPTIKYFCIDST